jgi:hypothetical protein
VVDGWHEAQVRACSLQLMSSLSSSALSVSCLHSPRPTLPYHVPYRLPFLPDDLFREMGLDINAIREANQAHMLVDLTSVLQRFDELLEGDVSVDGAGPAAAAGTSSGTPSAGAPAAATVAPSETESKLQSESPARAGAAAAVPKGGDAEATPAGADGDNDDDDDEASWDSYEDEDDVITRACNRFEKHTAAVRQAFVAASKGGEGRLATVAALYSALRRFGRAHE